MSSSPQSRTSRCGDETTTTSSGAWSSGRILTRTQRERKRQMDRLNQMKKRRASSTIVESLQAQVDCLSSEFSKLSNRLASETSTQSDQGSIGTAGVVTAVSPLPSIPVDAAFVAANDTVGPCPQEHAGLRADDGFHDLLTPATDAPDESDTVTHAHQLRKDRQLHVIQQLVNELLQEACLSTRGSICSDELLNQDALIRGIVHGWETVTSLAQYCPLLEVISRLDRFIFSYSRTITRFCTLRMIHYMLMFLTGIITAQELPVWYRPRPSQKRFRHDVAVDILPWPGLRERAVLDQDITKSDQFWRDVIQLFEFNWPYNVEDAFWLNPSSGLYTFTGLYEQQVREIRMWNMNPTFFASFPDTFEDIVPAANISTSLSFSASMSDLHRFLSGRNDGEEATQQEEHVDKARDQSCLTTGDITCIV